MSLAEAMHLGLPVVAVATTEVCEAVPPSCGFVTNDIDALIEHAGALMRDPERARSMGEHARRFARERHGLERFLAEWDVLLQEVA
jgi:glycosyltransferase involved in cell wall biosynthesis